LLHHFDLETPGSFFSMDNKRATVLEIETGKKDIALKHRVASPARSTTEKFELSF
jgi:hypothetical protein